MRSMISQVTNPKLGNFYRFRLTLTNFPSLCRQSAGVSLTAQARCVGLRRLISPRKSMIRQRPIR